MPRPRNETINQEKALLRQGLLACRKCHETKPTSEFGHRASIWHGFQTECKPCINNKNRAYVAANPTGKEKKAEYQRRSREKNGPADPATTRRHNLWRYYRITPEDYDHMLEEQGGRCAICGTDDPYTRSGSFFHVDHNHTTNAVRGLLCGRCNPALGAFQESEAVLLAAIDYLRHYAVSSDT